jgi:hypothetical protein
MGKAYTCHLFFKACPCDPNIWSLGLGELYEMIFGWHVMGEEKYECWIEKLSMRN